MKHSNLTILIKPVSGLCQLFCKYCFYRELAEQNDTGIQLMQPEVVSGLIKRISGSVEKNQKVTFAFQGGEPLLAGPDFYESFFDAVKEANISANYLFQTNGIELTSENGEAYINLFQNNNCLIGLSVDGPRKTHDANRIDINRKGTYDTVMQAYVKLRSANIKVNFLTVLSEAVLKHPESLYAFYKNSDIKYVQLIPCLPSLKNEDRAGLKYYNELLTLFWIKFYDLWKQDYLAGNCCFEVREFSSILNGLSGRIVESCIFPGKCSPQLVVEADGSTYPCDFYVLPQYRTGSVLTDSIEDTLRSDNMLSFAKENPPLGPQCTQCRYRSLCKGGCRRMRQLWQSDPEHCSMRTFLDHVCGY